jgi:hypothetical protein
MRVVVRQRIAAIRLAITVGRSGLVKSGACRAVHAPRAAAVRNLFSSGASALLAVAEIDKFERTEAG